ncbi:hypothetical protein GCM10010517_52020 [Streptosporangium fragile]|uniref:Ankyrin repeat domain-containing protein n=1 Tax=Streptosporangium fragile TaxID=46186 RepID=A0ABN3W2D3_9ACTN
MISRLFPPDEASSWQRVRRYAVPRWMIEQATERRLAGDWRGACAAANVDIAFDLGDIAAEYGAEAAAAIEDDLLNLAPDLLRWHLPRALGGRTTIGTGEIVILAGLDRAAPPTRERPGPWLHTVPLRLVDGPQRLTLAFGSVPRGSRHDWTGARHLWDARRTGELLARCGGSTRAPFFHADGTPRAEKELPSGPSLDPAENTEWVTGLHERGDVEAACAAAGIELAHIPPAERRPRPSDLPKVLAGMPLALTRLAEEVRLTGHGSAIISYGWRYRLQVEAGRDGARVRVADSDAANEIPVMAEARWRRLPDLDLLRTGRMSPDALHPLVHAALFPAATTPARGPAEAVRTSPFPVRCRGEWHEVGPDLSMPHDDAERRRERALRVLGGAVAGCFAVEEAWAKGTGRLPRALREQRRELFLRAQHGDTPGVLRLLDAGVDPRARDGRGRTLLHALHLLDHEPLLPRLLDAGLDLEATDHNQRTALHVAVGTRGSEALVRALLAAGARIDVVDCRGWSIRDLIRWNKRAELAFLARQITPGLGSVVTWFPDRDEKDE